MKAAGHNPGDVLCLLPDYAPKEVPLGDATAYPGYRLKRIFRTKDHRTLAGKHTAVTMRE